MDSNAASLKHRNYKRDVRGTRALVSGVREVSGGTRVNLPHDNEGPATMTSLTPLLCRHLHRYYDVTNPATMPSLTPLL